MDKKTYTPEEVAKKILEKTQEMYKKSKLYKSNTAHEIEPGSEPVSEGAECPEYLQGNGEAPSDSKYNGKKKEKENEVEEKAEAKERDEEDADIIEEDKEPENIKEGNEEESEEEESEEEESEEEESEEENEKKIKKIVEKSEELIKKAEKYNNGLPIDLKKEPKSKKLKNFLDKKIEKKQGVPKGADPEVHERCVKKVKAKGHDKESAYRICNEVKAGVKKADIHDFQSGKMIASDEEVNEQKSKDFKAKIYGEDKKRPAKRIKDKAKKIKKCGMKKEENKDVERMLDIKPSKQSKMSQEPKPALEAPEKPKLPKPSNVNEGY